MTAEAVVSGPRDLLPKDSPEYARRTIGYLRSVWIKTEGATRELEQVVEEAKSARVWERWPTEQPYGSWEEMLRSEIGASDAEVEQEVVRLRSGKGRPKINPEKGNNITFKSPTMRGDTREYLLARLRRDAAKDADGNYDAFKRGLLDAVERGELSVSQAAIQAGYAKPTLTIPRDPIKAAATIVRNLSREDAAALAREVVAALDDLEDGGNPGVPTQVAVRDGARFG